MFDATSIESQVPVESIFQKVDSASQTLVPQVQERRALERLHVGWQRRQSPLAAGCRGWH